MLSIIIAGKPDRMGLYLAFTVSENSLVYTVTQCPICLFTTTTKASTVLNMYQIEDCGDAGETNREREYFKLRLQLWFHLSLTVPHLHSCHI